MIIKKDDLCPACGYNILENLGLYPWDGDSSSLEICPSCGIQFGYDDMAGGDLIKRQEIYKKWRDNWIKNGMKWWSDENDNRPRDWNPKEQLENLLN